MTRLLSALAMAAALAAVPAFAADAAGAQATDQTAGQTAAQTDEGHNVKHDAQTFAKDAYQGNLMEVQAGQTAQQKSTNQQVKDFGQKLVTDHGQANTDLKEAMQSENITAPTTLDKKHEKAVQKIKDLPASSFDRDFINMMVKDHKHDISVYERAEKDVDNPQIKSYITKTLPVLREHLQIAERIQKSLGTTAKD